MTMRVSVLWCPLLVGCALFSAECPVAIAQVVPLSTPTYTFTIPPGPTLSGATNSTPPTNITVQTTQTITNDSNGPVWQNVWTVLGTNGLTSVFTQTITSVRTTMSLSSMTSSDATGSTFTMGSDDLLSPPPACGDTNNPDSDNDGLPDSVENAIYTDPNNPDTDGDGYSDLQEVVLGTSPFDPCVYPAIPLNLLAWWTFDDGTGSYATDASGNLQTGVLEGSPSTNAIPTWVTNGVANGALSFDGSNSFLVAPATALFCALTTQVTVSAWIDAQNQLAGGGPPIAKWNGVLTGL
jgi:thrombospondin type 3 repeat protein